MAASSRYRTRCPSPALPPTPIEPRRAALTKRGNAQVEYAAKAVENAGTVIGLRVKDGIVLAVEKLVQSKLLVPGANKRIASVDQHAGIVSPLAPLPSSDSQLRPSRIERVTIEFQRLTSLSSTLQATAGLLADGRHVANRARDEAESYKETYHTPIPTKVRYSSHNHLYTPHSTHALSTVYVDSSRTISDVLPSVHPLFLRSTVRFIRPRRWMGLSPGRQDEDR